MRFYQHLCKHRFYCGIDLHARSMYLCILDQAGNIQRHRSRPLPLGMDRHAWPSVTFQEGNTRDGEAALGTSHCLTETVSERNLAILNGRRRGTKDFLGRLGNTRQSAKPR